MSPDLLLYSRIAKLEAQLKDLAKKGLSPGGATPSILPGVKVKPASVSLDSLQDGLFTASAAARAKFAAAFFGADATSRALFAAGIFDAATAASIFGAGAIPYSRVTLTGAVVNADIAVAAAIARSKLDFGSGLVNADIAAAAAIVYSKLSLAASILTSDMADAAKARPLFGSMACGSNATLVYGSPQGMNQTTNTTEDDGFKWIAPVAGKVGNLRTRVALAAGTYTFVLKVRINGADSTLVVTIVNPGAGAITVDTTHFPTVAQNDVITVSQQRTVGSGGSANTLAWIFDFIPT